MAGVQTGIQLNDQFTSVMYGILNCVSMANAQMSDLSSAMNQNIDTSGWEAIQSEISQATILMDELAASIDDTAQPISQNTEAQERFNREVQEGVQEANQLNGVLSKVGVALLGGAAIKKAANWIEECTEAFDAQRNAELQLLTVLANTLDADYVSSFAVETEVTADTTEAVTEINGIQNQVDDVTVMATANTKALTAAFDTITAKASEIQSRGIYGDEVMIAGAAEFSTYFSDTEAIEMMMDTLADYAMGMSGGGEIDSNAMVNYATGLGKVMTGSYDAMTKKGFEFTEAQKAVIEGTATQEQIIAAIGEEYLNASQDVQAAAAINAVIAESWGGLYESMSNTPQGQIIQMTNAWGDMKEVIGGQLYPFVLRFVQVITNNWPTIQKVIYGITGGLQIILGILSWLLEGAISVASAIIENWSWISPIIYGVAGALAVYYGWLLLTKGAAFATAAAQALLTGAKMLAVPVYAALTGATMADTAAQWGLNSAMYACPIVWIIILIVALIALFYAAVAAINKFAGTSISATGLIAGYFAVCTAHLINGFVRIQNMAASFANFLGNFIRDPIAAIEILFYDMCLAVIGYILNMASAIEEVVNKIPGVEVDITGGLDSFYSKLEKAQQEVKDEAGWVEYVGKWDYIDYTDAFDAGYSFGEGIEDKVSNLSLTDLFAVDPIPSMEDYLDSNDFARDIDDIAEDTGNISDSLDITSEDLKYLRDIAEQDTINRFTTAEIKVDMSGMQNTVNSGDDIDGFMTKLTDSVNEAIDNMTEGVHE